MSVASWDSMNLFVSSCQRSRSLGPNVSWRSIVTSRTAEYVALAYVGLLEGDADGDKEGACEDGEVDGVLVGEFDGEVEGDPVEGAEVGNCDWLGAAEGYEEGLLVGEFVGAIDGR
mmetsp:Transcript_7474/g.11727  ORF Transcript_7474/g.11727 Transcript_7474/m.11727 type:complete len:116 (-) Transcript_7474:552-899(-)